MKFWDKIELTIMVVLHDNSLMRTFYSAQLRAAWRTTFMMYLGRVPTYDDVNPFGVEDGRTKFQEYINCECVVLKFKTSL